MAETSIVSSCLVAMATATTSAATMDLTPWDLQCLALEPIQKGILLQNPDSDKTLILHLQHSLARTLDYFPPLAGRLKSLANQTSFVIDCNNAGVEFTHAIAPAISISDILEPKYTPEIVSSFFPLTGTRNYQGVSIPLLAVQITELVDGFFLGCTANHSVVDGVSFWHFINCWSEISRGYQTLTKPPNFNRWIPNSLALPISIPPFNPNPNLQASLKPPTHERVFHFSKENLAKLKAKANSEAGGRDEIEISISISTLQALTAHLWRSIVRCRIGEKGYNSEETNMVVLVGARPRIPLPEGYFGNAAYGVRAEARVEELVGNGMGYAAVKMSKLVRAQSSEAAVKFVEDWVKKPEIISIVGLNFVISSSPRHNVYGNDFGWGKPIAVRSGKAQKFEGKLTVYQAADTGGIDVEACLSLHTLEAMENDAEFMEFVSL